MPRNSQGLYTLPAGNPVVPNTLIEANWANPTMDDIAAALTGSLPRDGSAPMTGPLTLASGMPTAPRHATSKAFVEQFLAYATGLPIGAVVAYAGSAVPPGYFECNGQAVSRTTYADLFIAIGTTYGVGDTSTTFNVPDMRDEFIRGKSAVRAVGSKQAAAFASHIHATSDPGHGHTLTDPGHAHSASQPAHTHGVSDPGHAHGDGVDLQISGATGDSPVPAPWLGTTSVSGTGISIQAGGGDAVTVNGAATGVSLANNTTGLSIGAAGGDETRPQNIAQIYIIKAVNDSTGSASITGIDTSDAQMISVDNTNPVVPELVIHSNVAFGTVKLDASGKVPLNQMPTDSQQFMGYFDASSGNLPVGVFSSGSYFIISVTGTLTVFDPVTLVASPTVVGVADQIQYVSGSVTNPNGWYYIVNAENVRWSQLKYDGQSTVVIPTTAVQGSKSCENTSVTDESTIGTYAMRFAGRVKTGNFSNGSNDIGDTLINRYSSISSGQGWGRWDVITSPLPVGSGYPLSPSLAQSFYLVAHEYNAQNRTAPLTQYQPEARLYTNPVAGIQVAAETQDFGAESSGASYGYNCAFNYAMSPSPYVASTTGEAAKFMTGLLMQPNTIANGGIGLSLYGYRDYITTIGIVSGGSGYAVGNQLTFSTGLPSNINEEASVEVTAVDGGGAVTGARLHTCGGYKNTPAATVGVTGGSGLGATFSWTMSTAAAKQPRAMLGILGGAVYGIDMCLDPVQNYAKFTNGSIRVPNNAPIVAMTSGGAVNAALIGLNTADQVVLGDKKIIPETTFTPVISAGSGTIASSSALTSTYSQINGMVTATFTFLISDKGTAAGTIVLDLPVPARPDMTFSGSGMNVSTFRVLGAISQAGSNKVALAGYDGTDPFINGNYYAVTFVYSAQNQ